MCSLSLQTSVAWSSDFPRAAVRTTINDAGTQLAHKLGDGKDRMPYKQQIRNNGFLVHIRSTDQSKLIMQGGKYIILDCLEVSTDLDMHLK